jgi:ubiquitin carboxyl-terminal hydrolase 34
MSAQGHVLKQPSAADELATTFPPPSPSLSPSPPRRDPVEDADPSFTRKRPRLDSGSNSLCTMSAGSESPAGATTSPPPELVEMTIRSHPPSSPAPAPAAAGGVSVIDGTSDEPILDPDGSPIIMLSAEDDRGSPPIMIIDDDDEDDDDDPAEAERLDPESHFASFPSAHPSDYSTAVRDLVQYVQGSTSS